jgi:hypothetical protein
MTRTPATRARGSRSALDVDGVIATLRHPMTDDIQALRRIVLAAAAGIGESVKWDAPSFHTTEHFATLRLGGRRPLQLILHFGAKKMDVGPIAIDDPEGLLRWLAPDRACIDLSEHGAAERHAAALQAILRGWIRHLPASTSPAPRDG